MSSVNNERKKAIVPKSQMSSSTRISAKVWHPPTQATPLDRLVSRKRRYKSPRHHEDFGKGTESGDFEKWKWKGVKECAKDKVFGTNQR
jgi:hypothetical protein